MCQRKHKTKLLTCSAGHVTHVQIAIKPELVRQLEPGRHEVASSDTAK